MIENEIAKFEKPDQVRPSSCLYPSFASSCSSDDSSFDSLMSAPGGFVSPGEIGSK